jgi:hypothetical protein
MVLVDHAWWWCVLMHAEVMVDSMVDRRVRWWGGDGGGRLLLDVEDGCVVVLCHDVMWLDAWQMSEVVSVKEVNEGRRKTYLFDVEDQGFEVKWSFAEKLWWSFEALELGWAVVVIEKRV